MAPNVILAQLVNVIFGIIELLLGLRLILRFFAAGAAPFVEWVYRTSDPLVYPFRGMFPNPVLTGGYVLEINTLIALLIYALIGYLIGELVAFLSYHSMRYYRSQVIETNSRKRSR
jgi:uncharacterized protein YggT (Ycf19 family)